MMASILQGRLRLPAHVRMSVIALVAMVGLVWQPKGWHFSIRPTYSHEFAALMAKLRPELRLDSQLGFETITGRSRYHVNDVVTGFLIELFQLDDDPHNQSRFARRRETVSCPSRISSNPQADAF